MKGIANNPLRFGCLPKYSLLMQGLCMFFLLFTFLLVLIPAGDAMFFYGIPILLLWMFSVDLRQSLTTRCIDNAEHSVTVSSTVVMLQCNLHGINDLMQQPSPNTLLAVSTLSSAISQSMAAVEKHQGGVDRSCYDRFLCVWPIGGSDGYQQATSAMSCALEISEIFAGSSALLAKSGFLPVTPFIAISSGEGVFTRIKHGGSSHDVFVSQQLSSCQQMISEARRFGISIAVGNGVARPENFVLVDISGSFMALVGRGNAPASQLGQHQKMLSLYGEKRYEAAMVISQSLRTAWNGNLTLYYEWMMERCKMLSRR